MPDAIGSLTSTATGATGTNQAEVGDQLGDLGFDTFLKLLVTQIENQDPLNPMDGTAFTEQLATFSQLEQQMQSNQYLEDITQANNYSAQTLAVSYIGKEVLAPSGIEFESAEIGLVEDGQTTFAYSLDRVAASAKVEIRDSAGVLVRTLEGGKLNGVNTITWDGKDEAGDAAEEGFYNVQVTALDSEGTKAVHRLYTYNPVTAVAADGSIINLNLLDGREVSFDDVLQVQGLDIAQGL